MKRVSLVILVLACAALYALMQARLRIRPALPTVAVMLEGKFTLGGQYPGEPFSGAASVRNWGSWSGSDDHEGRLVIGPFPAPRVLRLALSGYPNNAGNELYLQREGSTTRLPLQAAAVGEHWRIDEFKLPSAWVDTSVTLIAVDRAKSLGGWLAVSEPLRGGRSEGNNALLESLTAWTINGLALGVLFFAALRWLRTRELLAPHWLPLGAAAVVASAGYAVFWIYFANALAGKIASWILLALGAAVATARDRGGERDGGHRAPHQKQTSETATGLTLTVAIGVFYLALLHLFPTAHDFYTLGANRFREGFPTDNELSHGMAERLFAGRSVKVAGDEWRASDRPPLQTGWQLLTWPLGRTLGLDTRTFSGTAAIWLQLSWVAAAYGLLRALGVAQRRAVGWVAVFALSGFFLQNTVFTWPKLSAGAFVCGAFAMACLRAGGTNLRPNAILCAAFAALAWLTHGGVAFSLLALAPVIAWRFFRGEMRAWLPAAGVLLIFVVPWFAFQKLYDPPGNRLLKWHLAGQTAVDARGTWETIRDSYARAGWKKAAANKTDNFVEQVRGDWRELFDVSAADASQRRKEEFAHTFRALTWWPVLALFALVLPRQRASPGFRDLIPVIGWLMLTLLLWCLLMFGPATTVIHQGSYALMLGLFVVFSVVLERLGRGWLAALAVLQAIVFATTWPRANATIHGSAAGLPFVIAAGVVLAWFIGRAVFAGAPQPLAALDGARARDVATPPTHSSFATRMAAWFASLRAWWRDPQLNGWVLAALAVLLALRKPHALHTPQLWAEDGSIFLMQADMHGVSSLAMPYMGYLHLLPRLIAWIAPRLLDPAWWPGFYNGVSFVIWVAVLGRFFSRRLNLPGKPWLVLAFFLGVNTGEVLFNITNLQWLTAFVLIQQAIITPPANHRERWCDLLMLAVVGLTGPFVAAFAPLFAWRWWRRRSWDNFAVLALLGVCAAIQAWFVLKTGPKFDYQSEPVRLLAMVPVIARRLIVWPVLGERLALGLPNAVVGALGGTILAGLLAWTLRPHPRRAVRAPIVAAFGLIMLASVFRTRPDTWAADNLVFGDRYFYIPRVLVAWLLIWEFNATPRFIGGFARVLCLMAVLVHARDYVLPAPQDYRWKDHCEPIRRGVRADIPTLPEGWTLEYHGRPQPPPR